MLIVEKRELFKKERKHLRHVVNHEGFYAIAKRLAEILELKSHKR